MTAVSSQKGDGPDAAGVLFDRRRVLLVQCAGVLLVVAVLRFLGLFLPYGVLRQLVTLSLFCGAMVPIFWTSYHLVHQMSCYRLGERHPQFRPLDPWGHRLFDFLALVIVSYLATIPLGW